MEVVDGKQRLTSIWAFLTGEFPVRYCCCRGRSKMTKLGCERSLTPRAARLRIPPPPPPRRTARRSSYPAWKCARS